MLTMSEIKDSRSRLRREQLEVVEDAEHCRDCLINTLHGIIGVLQQYVTDEQWNTAMTQVDEMSTNESHHDWGV